MFSWIRKRRSLSLVVIVYRMADQAEKTLYSLSPRYQRDVGEDDYEVVVVENASDWNLGAARATQFAGNVRYFLREEPQRTPVHAVNFGVQQARSSHVTIMVDGARMVTPGIVRHTLDVFRMAPHAAVTAPSYHLGERLQQVAVNDGYDRHAEAALLQRIGWPEDGYRLFEIGVFAGSYRGGVFVSNYESNALAISVKKWKRLGGMDPRYNDFGGGAANLDLYKRALELLDTPFYVLFGEGSFHQFYAGVTTGTLKAERDEIYPLILAQDLEIRGEDRDPPAVQPILYGRVPPPAYRFISESLRSVGVQ